MRLIGVEGQHHTAVDYQIGEQLKVILNRLHEADFGAMIPRTSCAKDAVDWLCPPDWAAWFHVQVNPAVGTGKPRNAFRGKGVLTNYQPMGISFLRLLEFCH